MNQSQKTCPACAQIVPLGSTVCPRCNYPVQNVRHPQNSVNSADAYSAPNSMYTFVKGIPVWGCFLIGLFLHLPAFVLLVLYFGDYPSNDRARGAATAWGLVAPFCLGCLGLFGFLPMIMAIVFGRH